MKKEIRLPKKSTKLWQIRIGLLNLILMLILYKLCYITAWMLIPLAIILIVALIAIFWYIPCFFSRYRVVADSKSLTIESGVFLKRIYIMPYPRMIYIYTFSTPLAHKYGVSAAILKAARGNIVVPEMLNSDIKTLLKISAGGCDD